MAHKGKTLGLFEFLEQAELQQYYNSLKNILQVQNVQQLKYVVEEDLFNIGMSRPEARRLKIFFQKLCPQNYASKLKKLLRPTKKDELKQEYLLGEETDSGSSHLKSRRYSTLSNIRVPNQHIIPADAIAIQKELGSGEFGVVQQGVWTDDEQMRHQVAVKCLSKERMQNNTLEFMKEYEIMQAIDHPNVVRLYGVVLDSAEIMLITELAPLRSLLECLKEISLRPTFTVPCLSSFAIQICQGMRYLEAKRLIHRDLAARNILVFSKNMVKVSDFGLSRALGVGKDYYQTNFSVNLKLPIAWCAPECINFLKFTSASDVWAFGVTLWEMFSYGFQPWAAQTGQQILEAIDQPQSLRLEQPVYCPKEHYGIMLQTWKHEPQNRPTFEKLVTLLEDAKPEQVQAINSSFRDFNAKDLLEFEVGDIITVLDKHDERINNVGPDKTILWTGCLNIGNRVGLFSPSNTVAYVATLPAQGNHSRWQNEETYGQFSGSFHRNSLRGSKGSRRKISRDMISSPRGEVQHTGHIGPDGAIFGNVAGFQNQKWKSNSAMMASGKELPFTSMPSLTRADSDASERVPLISGGRGGSSSSTTSVQNGNGPADNQVAAATANKNPRMGYAIGYLRKSSQNSSVEQSQGGTLNAQKHEYQTISDEEFGGPLDLGPSLMDEVFNELESSKDSDPEADNPNQKSDNRTEKKDRKSHSMRDMKDLVSSTLTISNRRHKKKQQATVKPIKASDEKTLDEAIALANALASKSLHDLDKRHLDDFYDNSPLANSPLSPLGSPSKKFSFWFPGKASSPRSDGKHFIDEANDPQKDVHSIITPGAKDAYKVLIEGKDDSGSSKATSPKSPACGPLPPLPVVPTAIQDSNNPLPLPPKSQKLVLSQPPKRHVRKNPLIISSGVSANLLRREGVSEHVDVQVAPSYSVFKAPRTPVQASKTTSYSTIKSNQIHPESSSVNVKSWSNINNPCDDAFENEIACSIDALDNIEPPKANESSLKGPDLKFQSNQEIKVSNRNVGRTRGENSDEVQVMKKVLGQDLSTDLSVQALDLTDWNIHNAIKLIKLKNIIKAPGLTDIDMKVALQTRDWDVAKAANVLMKKLTE